MSCHYHEGTLIPFGPEASALTRSERQQIAKCGKFALRKCGGVAGRKSRQGGRGHWTKGLGLPAVVAGKVMVWEDVCIGPGEVLCAWPGTQSLLFVFQWQFASVLHVASLALAWLQHT